MKKKIIFLTLIFSLIIGSMIAFAKIDYNNTETNKEIKAQIVFSEKIKLEEIKDLSVDPQVQIYAINNVSNVEGREYYGYYLLNENMSLEEAINDYKEQYSSLLTDAIISINKQLSEMEDSEEKKSVENLLKDTEKRLEKFEKDKKIEIYAFEVTGNEDNIQKLYKNNTKIKEINLNKK